MSQVPDQQASIPNEPIQFPVHPVPSTPQTPVPPNPPMPADSLALPGLFQNIKLDTDALQFPSMKYERWKVYGASLVLTARIIPLPIVVAFITALIYIAPPSGLPYVGSPDIIGVLIDGVIITALLWLATSALCTGFTSFEVANAQSSSHLKRHLLNLQSTLLLVTEKIAANGANGGNHGANHSLAAFRSKNPEDYDLALTCMYENICGAIKQLKSNDAQSWMNGNGYLKVWNFIHLAEEAMLIIAPREFVIREALHDEAAINGSDIALHDVVLSNIKTAVKKLSPSAGMYLKSLPAQDRNVSPDNGTIQQPSTVGAALRKLMMACLSLLKLMNHNSSSDSPEHEGPDPTIELEARNALRDARQILNDFRATQWDGLVRLRNQIFGTSLFTASLTYTLLCAAIIGGIDRAPLKAALFFYLVGATVGLFSRLYTERQSDSAIDDYGLAIARVTVTPIISGVAAIAGVLIVSFLSLNILNTPGTAASGLPPLTTIYDLVADRQGIIIAALFGFAPNL